ncbi:MAG: alginate biosynthesis protein [Billgrantia sp.]|uniref:Alginate biosynthesis protein n=1 Tax=Billgrantia desiderata TaxID=52021 RepID=A0ABS9BAX1_9GAMM|nr:alginate biosynthesis protein [Halomonas desiderata]MCE8044295.1 alginate biosynthesis protein [Halomonas desiderata]MCE8048869.1 alginate biosynthesis protein [Halomonas desiderata]
MSVLTAGPSTTAAALQTLIDDAPSGATIELSAGDYRLDGPLTIDRSDLTLTGAGSDATRLTFTRSALDQGHAIKLDGTADSLDLGTLDAAARQGETSIAIDAELEVGDTLRLWQDNDSAFLDEIGDSAWRKQEHAELRTSMAKVTAVEEGRVSLDRGVHFDFEAGKTQVERVASVDDVALSGFGIDFDIGTPDAASFQNTESELTGFKGVYLDGTTGSQLHDIEVKNGPSTAFHVSRSVDADVTDISAEGALNKGSGGNGYAFELRESYDGTFTGLEDSGMRHGLVFASWRSSVDNDVEIARTDRDVNFHGGRDHGNQVRVERSLRDPESDGLSPTLWVNEVGEAFGAPTDPDANQVRFDYVVGSRRDDVIRGSDDGVYLNGGLGDDTLIGGAGNDILQSGPGDDWNDGEDVLIGGGGTNTARYTSDFDAYRIDFADDTVRIRDDKGTDDTLSDMQYAVFGDGTTLHLASRSLFDAEPMPVPDEREVLASDDGLLPPLIDDTAELVVTGNTLEEWGDGHSAEIFVENVTQETLALPDLRFELDDELDTLWNGDFSREGETYRVGDSRELAPGEAWRFAYRAQGDDKQLPQAMEADDLELQLLGMDAPRFDEALA